MHTPNTADITSVGVLTVDDLHRLERTIRRHVRLAGLTAILRVCCTITAITAGTLGLIATMDPALAHRVTGTISSVAAGTASIIAVTVTLTLRAAFGALRTRYRATTITHVTRIRNLRDHWERQPRYTPLTSDDIDQLNHIVSYIENTDNNTYLYRTCGAAVLQRVTPGPGSTYEGARWHDPRGLIDCYTADRLRRYAHWWPLPAFIAEEHHIGKRSNNTSGYTSTELNTYLEIYDNDTLELAQRLAAEQLQNYPNPGDRSNIRDLLNTAEALTR
jgi:hypothetical protein